MILKQFGAWQVREDAVRCPYRGIEISAKALSGFESMGRIQQDLLRRLSVNQISEAEEVDLVSALDWGTQWYQATPGERLAWHPELCAQPKQTPTRQTSIDRLIERKKALRFEILKRDGYRCQLCGASAEEGVRLEVDHKLPRARGGTDDPMNLWVLCFDCNRGKGVQDV